MTPIRTKLAQLIFLEAWPDVEQDRPFIEGLAPALDRIINFFGEDFAGLQCVENIWINGVITQSSCESVPEFILNALSYEATVLRESFGFHGQSIDLTFWSHESYGKVATINISDSGSSGVDGGLLICTRPRDLKDYLTPTNVTDQEYVSR